MTERRGLFSRPYDDVSSGRGGFGIGGSGPGLVFGLSASMAIIIVENAAMIERVFCGLSEQYEEKKTERFQERVL